MKAATIQTSLVVGVLMTMSGYVSAYGCLDAGAAYP